MNTTLLSRAALSLASLCVLGGAAYADPLPATVSFGDTPVTEANMNTKVTLDIIVDFDPGVYRGMKLKIAWPSGGITGEYSASPTSGEFEAATRSNTGYVWDQPIDEPVSTNPADDRRWFAVPQGGTAKRQFRIRVGTPRFAFLDLTTRDFTVTLTGDVAPAITAEDYQARVDSDQLDTLDALTYETTAIIPAVHTITFRGAATFGWAGVGNATGNATGRLGADGTTPGIVRRFVFAPRNNGIAQMGAPVDYAVSWGSGYKFVRAGAGIYSPTYDYGFNANPANLVFNTAMPAAWSGAGSIDATTVTNLSNTSPGGSFNGANQAFFLELWVPCSAFAKSEEASAIANESGVYSVQGSAATKWIDAQGEDAGTIAYHLDSPILGNDADFTAVCGEGESMTMSHYYAVLGVPGTTFDWRMVVKPPFGVDKYERAMLALPLPIGQTEIIAMDPDASPLAQSWRCDFSATPGPFTIDEFLARRDDQCDAGGGTVTAAHTVLVFYDEDRTTSAAGLSFMIATNVSYAYALAHPGQTHTQSAFFKADTELFGDVSFSKGANSPPIPSSGTVTVRMKRQASFAQTDTPAMTNLDANGGTGNVYVRVSPRTGLWCTNPSFEMAWPDGVVIEEIDPLTPASASPATSPAPPYTSPAGWSVGTNAEPYTLSGNVGGHIRFHVDPNYPWINGQAITFTAVGRADDDATGDHATSIDFIAQVATGMDFHIAGGCWNEAAWGGWSGDSYVAAPNDELGLLAYKVTAINRGEDDLDGLELYYIVPTAAGAFRAVVPGPDLPSDAVIEISRDNGATWTSTLPSGVDASVTTVRATGIAIPGLGLDAPRPSFYVGIRPNNGLTEAIGRGYAFTEMYGLNATQTKEVTVDATVCRPPCGPCADPTPNDDCSMAACNSAGECETVYRDLGASCEYSGADKLCVTGPFTCQGSRELLRLACGGTGVVTCSADDDTCTDEVCDVTDGMCHSQPVRACADPTYFTSVVDGAGNVIGAFACTVYRRDGLGGGVIESVECEMEKHDGVAVLAVRSGLGNICGN